MQKSYRPIDTIDKLICKKDLLCEKTVDHMMVLAETEYQKDKISKEYGKAKQEIKEKDKEIIALKNTYEQLNEALKEIKENYEIQRLKQQVSELMAFKKNYEQLLKEIEKEKYIDDEINVEINRLQGKKEPISDIHSYIKQHLFITEEEYDRMISQSK